VLAGQAHDPHGALEVDSARAPHVHPLGDVSLHVEGQRDAEPPQDQGHLRVVDVHLVLELARVEGRLDLGLHGGRETVPAAILDHHLPHLPDVQSMMHVAAKAVLGELEDGLPVGEVVPESLEHLRQMSVLDTICCARHSVLPHHPPNLLLLQAAHPPHADNELALVQAARPINVGRVVDLPGVSLQRGPPEIVLAGPAEAEPREHVGKFGGVDAVGLVDVEEVEHVQEVLELVPGEALPQLVELYHLHETLDIDGPLSVAHLLKKLAQHVRHDVDFDDIEHVR